jgi:NADP-dependent 3-hydroxy acid dehydrogenase YdfG
MKLEAGQVAVVTGGASGIGLALARSLGERGLSLVIADVESSALEQAADGLRTSGVKVLARKIDVRDGHQVDDLAAASLERFGRVDVVCNNAGVVGPWAPMWELTTDDWSWVVEVNLWGVIHGIRAFVPHLIERGSGHVLNTASMAGVTALPGNAPYCATKHAVVAITETLRRELVLAGTDVGATVLCPGLTTTNIATSARNRPVARSHAAESRGFRDSLSIAASQPMSADAVAKVAVAGIEENRLLVMTGEASDAAARARFENLLGTAR